MDSGQLVAIVSLRYHVITEHQVQASLPVDYVQASNLGIGRVGMGHCARSD